MTIKKTKKKKKKPEILSEKTIFFYNWWLVFQKRMGNFKQSGKTCLDFDN